MREFTYGDQTVEVLNSLVITVGMGSVEEYVPSQEGAYLVTIVGSPPVPVGTSMDSQDNPIGITRTQSMEDIRAMRNIKLQKTDITQIADMPDSDEKAAWREYRMLLRDLPARTDVRRADGNVNWPAPPVPNYFE